MNRPPASSSGRVAGRRLPGPGHTGVFSYGLTAGVLETVRRTRPAQWSARDTTVLGGAALWATLTEARPTKTQSTPDDITAWFDTLAAGFSASRPLLLAVLFSPDTTTDLISAELNVRTDDTVGVWLRLCWITEAIWRCVSGLRPPGPGYAAGDLDLLRPLAARMRFRVLSEPFRHRAEPGAWTLPGGIGGAPDDIAFALGPDSWHHLVASCREARWEWQRCLDEYQSHPLIAQAAPEELEAELDALVFARPSARTPLVVRWEPLNDAVPPAGNDKAVAAAVVENHFLPRFRLRPVIRLAVRGIPARRLVGTGVLAAPALVGVFLWCGWKDAAVGAACAGYALIAAGIVAFDPLWAAPWLLRLPAAGAVGLVALIPSLPSGWTHYRFRWAAAVLLVAAAYGYLLVECRNHGVGNTASARRALAVTAIGAVHAFLVSLIGLALIVPSFVGDAPALGGHQAWATLGLAAPWCLAVGVFSQILWDDRPITAPLAHMQWTRGR